RLSSACGAWNVLIAGAPNRPKQGSRTRSDRDRCRPGRSVPPAVVGELSLVSNVLQTGLLAQRRNASALGANLQQVAVSSWPFRLVARPTQVPPLFRLVQDEVGGIP